MQTCVCATSLLCQVKRGSIGVRKDPADPAEWQFTLWKVVAWTEEKSQHELKGEAKAKGEACQWLELKAQGLLAEGEGPAASSKAAKALEDVLSKDKSKLAIMDKDQEQSQASEEDKEASPKKDEDEQVVEADLLSEMGSKVVKEEAQVRVKRMMKLLKNVKKEVGPAKSSLWTCAWLTSRSWTRQGARSSWKKPKGSCLKLPCRSRRPRGSELLLFWLVLKKG